MTIEKTQKIPVAGEYEVIVAGGGLSGIAAALSAARLGRRVLLLEKQCWLGGLATTGLVNFWVPLCNGRGRQIIKGMAEEFLRLSIKNGFDTIPPTWKDGEPGEKSNERLMSWFSSGIFALELLKLLREAGVEILYDALITDAEMDDKRIKGLFVETKSGRRFYGAQAVVDATGDADVLHRAGVPTVEGENYFTYYGEGVSLESCEEAIKRKNVFYAYNRPFGGSANLYGKGQPEDEKPMRGVDADRINDFLQRNQLIMLEKIEKTPRMERNIHMLPGMPQLRTSRRIDGDQTLRGEDVYRHFENSIGAICDFDHRDRLYEVPYGTLVRKGYDNLITCGRSASASGWGWDVLRVIPPAVLTGQAAGIAAAKSIETNVPLPDLDVGPLQDALKNTGVIIHFDDNWVPENADTSPVGTAGHN